MTFGGIFKVWVNPKISLNLFLMGYPLKRVKHFRCFLTRRRNVQGMCKCFFLITYVLLVDLFDCTIKNFQII